ncbi:MAG: glycosyltransferase family 39 protein [Anaerolineae bacterium]|nr:glycosyltransferase family 39 protein [Anaerolineae bacterium]
MKNAYILPVLLFAVIGYGAGLTDNLFPGGDNARYLILAKSLLTGNGYRNIGTLTAPYHTLAPPGFPLLLTLVISVFGMQIILAKLIVGSFGLIAIGLVYALFKRNYSPFYATSIAALYGTAPVVLMYARRVYSDIPFMVFSLLSLLAVKHYATEESLFNKWLLLAALALAAAFYLRPIALTLLLASTLWFIIRKKLLQGILLLLFVVLMIAPWYAWVQYVNVDVAPGHFATFITRDGLPELVLRILTNITSYVKLFSDNIFYMTTKGLEHLGLDGFFVYLLTTSSVIFTCLLIVLGFIRSMHMKIDLIEIYMCIYSVVLLAYSLVLDRFIIPLIPFLIHYCIQGLVTITHIHRRQTNECTIRIITTGFVCCVLLSNSLQIVARLHQEQNFAVFAPAAASHYNIARWASTHLDPSSVVATDYPDFFYIYADRQAVNLTVDEINLADESIIHFFITDKSRFNQVNRWFEKLKADPTWSPLYCTPGSDICLYKIAWASEQDN